MPKPSTVIASPRPDLAAAFMEYSLEAAKANFVSLEILRPFSAIEQAGVFAKVKLESLLKERKTERAYGGTYNRGGWEFTNDSWATAEHGWEEPVDQRSERIYASFFDAELIATLRAVNAVLENQERRMADLIFDATTFSGQVTNVTNEWDDYANATPIDNVETASRAFYNRTGLWPDTLTINRLVFRNLRQCDQVLDRIAATGAGDKIKATDVTAEMLAQVFDVERVLVAGGSKDGAKEGQARSISQIWSSEYAALTVTAKTDDIAEPCTGRLFHWDEDGGDLLGAIESYEEPQTRSTIVRARHDVHEKILYTEAVQLLDNVTTL